MVVCRMIEKIYNQRNLIWSIPLSTAVGATILELSLIVYSAYARMIYFFLIAPLACLGILTLLLAFAVDRKGRMCLTLFLGLIAFFLVSIPIVRKSDDVRSTLRWLLWSSSFKEDLLARPAPANGGLKHIEWEATGFAGVADNTLYLVFDPTDSLSPAARNHSPGKYKGLPCEVLQVRRLEDHWYAVRFYTDEIWGERNALDCTGVT